MVACVHFVLEPSANRALVRALAVDASFQRKGEAPSVISHYR
jgi:hypothetical protein